MYLNKWIAISLTAFSILNTPMLAVADDLFKDSQWANIASDRKASHIGDVVSVVVYQNAESRNSSRNATQKRTSMDGEIRSDARDLYGNAGFGIGFTGRGEVQRSDSLVTQISAVIDDILPNGDYLISGVQTMHINGEQTTIGVRGRIRPDDITSDNQILSTKIANAEIDYNGTGFVSRGAKPGILAWLFNFLRLG